MLITFQHPARFCLATAKRVPSGKDTDSGNQKTTSRTNATECCPRQPSTPEGMQRSASAPRSTYRSETF